MARLTIWTENGAALDLDNPQNEIEAKQQLMEKYKLAINKLAEYEDADERLFSVLKPMLQSGSININLPVTDKSFHKLLSKRYDKSLNIVTVYKNPKDYPQKYVGRLFLIRPIKDGKTEPTNVFIVKDTLEELQQHIPKMYRRLNRDIKDDPVIYETWIW